MLRRLIPGNFAVSERILGKRTLLAMLLKMAWAYKRTLIYSLKKGGIKAAINFVYIKTFVPVGEGGGAAAFFIIGPLIKRFPRLAPYPRNIEIEVTTVCNRKCIICEHTYWKEKSRHLSLEEFKHIADQFPRLRWANLTGEGSAFLNKDYLSMLKYLKAKSIPLFLVDHFDSMDEKIAKELIQIGVDGIYISMDGATKETYEKIQVGCDFDRVVKNIKNFVALKEEMKSPIPELCFRFIVTTLNVHEMPQFVELVSSFGDRDSLGDGSHVDFAGLLEFAEIAHLKVPEVPEEILRDTVTAGEKHGVLLTFAHTQLQELPPLESCLAWMEPYIMMGGYVLPCCAVLMSNKREWLRQHSFGNVFEKSFEEIWYSERYTRFRQMVNKPHGKVPLFCKGCRGYNTVEREQSYGVDMEL